MQYLILIRKNTKYFRECNQTPVKNDVIFFILAICKKEVPIVTLRNVRNLMPSKINPFISYAEMEKLANAYKLPPV